MTEGNYTQCAACGHVKLHHKDNCAVEECSCPAFVDPGQGEHTCPSRMSEPGPWEQKENLDHWDTNRWGPYYMGRWPEQFHRPRTCSFCAGVHPDDAIKLVEQGWEVEVTGKFYKRYLHPPGYHKYITGVLKALQEYKNEPSSDSRPTEQLDEFKEPIPPVKLYVAHLSLEQAERFNRVVSQLPTKEST